VVVDNVIIRVVNGYLDNIVDHDEASNDERLTNFNSVNPCINIDSIGAKNRYVTHVDVIQNT